MQLTTGMLLGGLIQATLHLRAQETTCPAPGRLLRHSPRLQQWLCEQWLSLVPDAERRYYAGEPPLLPTLGWLTQESGGEPTDDTFFKRHLEAEDAARLDGVRLASSYLTQ